jgi:hypothetical protein
MGSSLGRFIVLFGYAVIIFLMVRPKSLGPTLVTNSANGVAAVIKAGTGGGTW